MQNGFCPRCGRRIDECICQSESTSSPHVTRRERVLSRYNGASLESGVVYSQNREHQAEQRSVSSDNGMPHRSQSAQPVPAESRRFRQSSASQPSGTPPARPNRRPAESPLRQAEGIRYAPRFMDIAMCNGEIPVRRYLVGRIPVFGNGEAQVLVTNRRLIYHSYSHFLLQKKWNLQEVSLDSVNGVNHYWGRGMRRVWFKYIVLALVLGIVSQLLLRGFNDFGIRFPLNQIKWVFYGLVFLFSIIAFRPSYGLQINASNSESTMGTAVNMHGVVQSGGNGIIFNFFPTKEAVTMMNELGACIMDLKVRGDYAIETWKNV